MEGMASFEQAVGCARLQDEGGSGDSLVVWFLTWWARLWWYRRRCGGECKCCAMDGNVCGRRGWTGRCRCSSMRWLREMKQAEPGMRDGCDVSCRTAAGKEACEGQ